MTRDGDGYRKGRPLLPNPLLHREVHPESGVSPLVAILTFPRLRCPGRLLDAVPIRRVALTSGCPDRCEKPGGGGPNLGPEGGTAPWPGRRDDHPAPA
jgi:hypothetical protein